SVWRGKIFSGGWVGGDLGTGLDASVIEPATGQEIGRTGIATPADVARAAQIAAAAQPAWAATPHTERSAILRRAAAIWLAHAADIEWWGIRESGKIRRPCSSRRTWPPRRSTRRPRCPRGP